MWCADQVVPSRQPSPSLPPAQFLLQAAEARHVRAKLPKGSVFVTRPGALLGGTVPDDVADAITLARKSLANAVARLNHHKYLKARASLDNLAPRARLATAAAADRSESLRPTPRATILRVRRPSCVLKLEHDVGDRVGSAVRHPATAEGLGQPRHALRVTQHRRDLSWMR